MSWVGSVSTHFTAALPTGHATQQVLRLRENSLLSAHAFQSTVEIELYWLDKDAILRLYRLLRCSFYVLTFAGQSVMPFHIFNLSAVYIPQAKAWGCRRKVLSYLNVSRSSICSGAVVYLPSITTFT